MGRPIKDIKDKDLNQLVYPKTHIKAVAVDNYSNLEDYLNNSGFVTSEDAGYDVNGVQLSFATPAEAQSYADTARQAAINYSKQYTEEQISSSVNSLNSQIQNSLNSLETELTAAISDNNDVILDMVDQTITDRLGDIDVEVPTLTSQLTNDSGFITEAPSDDVIYGRKNGEWVDVNQEFEPIGTIKTSEVGNVFGDKYVACNGALLDLADYPDLVSNYPLQAVNTPGVNHPKYAYGGFFKYVNGYYFIGSYKTLYYSNDLTKWNSVVFSSSTSTFLGNAYDIAYGNGVYCLATSGDIYYSNNLTTWTLGTNVVDNATTGGSDWGCLIHYSNGYFVTNPANGYIYYSSNGINWTKSISIGQTNTQTCPKGFINCLNGTWFIGNTSTIFMSQNLSTWTTLALPSSYSHEENYNTLSVVSGDRLYIVNNNYLVIVDSQGNIINQQLDNSYKGICEIANGVVLINSGSMIILNSHTLINDYGISYTCLSISSDGENPYIFTGNSLYKLIANKYQVPTIVNSYIKVLK